MSELCLRDVYQTLVLPLLLPTIIVEKKNFCFCSHFTGFFDVLFCLVADLIVNVHLYHLKCYINTIRTKYTALSHCFEVKHVPEGSDSWQMGNKTYHGGGLLMSLNCLHMKME